MVLKIKYDDLKKILLECGFKDLSKQGLLFSSDEKAYLFASPAGENDPRGQTTIYFYHFSVMGNMPFDKFYGLLSEEIREKLTYHLELFNL